MNIVVIQAEILGGNYRVSDHAVKRMLERSVERTDVEHIILYGEIIEEYPDDKYSPSCLIYGQTPSGRSLHVQVSLPPKVVVITVYEPESEEWLTYRIRRQSR